MSIFLLFQVFIHSDFLYDVIKTRDPTVSLLLRGCTHSVNLVVPHHHGPRLVQLAALHHVLVLRVVNIEDFKLPRSLVVTGEDSYIHKVQRNYAFM